MDSDTDGMPIYEGDDRIWQRYRKKLKREARQQLEEGNHPLIVVAKYFKDASYETLSDSDDTRLFTVR